LDVAPNVQVAIGGDLERCFASVKPVLALYIGGMGAREKNCYNDLACRYGYVKEAALIQNLYLSGKKSEVIGTVPDRLVDEVALCGPIERIYDRLAAFEDAWISTVICTLADTAALRQMASLTERL
jgi:hypothetical protein